MTAKKLDPNTFAGRRAERLAREGVEGVPERSRKTLKAGTESDQTGVGVTFVRIEA